MTYATEDTGSSHNQDSEFTPLLTSSKGSNSSSHGGLDEGLDLSSSQETSGEVNMKPHEYLVSPPPTGSEIYSRQQQQQQEQDEEDDDDDDDDNVSRILKIAKRPSFIWICTLGVVAFIIFQLTFLPRTSLGRDYRRWHGIHLTKSDVKRLFLQMAGIGNSHNSLTTEEYIDSWLTNFTSINSKSTVNMIADDNLELVSFVETNFKQFGFKTESFSYDAPHSLTRPVSSTLRLLDKNGQVAYSPVVGEPNFKTPAFYAFGTNASIVANFVFINEGTIHDYNLLEKHSIDVHNKIVIIKSNLCNKNITIAEKVAIAKQRGASGVINYYDFSASNNVENESSLAHAISRASIFQQFRLPSIPVSKKIIKPILDTLSADPQPDFSHWDYPPVGSTPMKVELNTTFAAAPLHPAKLTTVVASLKGIMNDADVIIGARRDSYTCNNPLSGHAILLEIMRNYQRLVAKGWKPLRNIKFVSWDGSNTDLIGSHKFTDDVNVYNPKRSIVAYINIDGDAVMGSKLAVDANPMLHSLLRNTAKFIPIPKEATSYKTLKNDDDDEDDEGYTTLHRYWMKQDNATINSVMGLPISQTESIIFQQHLGTPSINIKFENDAKRDSSVYVPNSNFYSKDWLIKREIDDDLLLHGSMIRFIGLLAISLSEHEVVSYKTHSYFKSIEGYFNELLEDKRNTLGFWHSEPVSNYVIAKSSIYQDLGIDNVKFGDLIRQFKHLMNETVYQSGIFDEWNNHVEDMLMQDYPWYLYYKKLQHFAQFKVTNYKLSHLERDLKLQDKDYQYLNKDKSYYDSVIYGTKKFDPAEVTQEYFNDKLKTSTFTHLYSAIEVRDFEMTVKWLVLIYEKFKNLRYKMT
ncbi:uncharacterized protein SPAPADRAFT_48101 [Spathaspora passalidarum NRRL Y-27907]|uniref:Peptide hydrolase n=1 Tax=Spathaspora passalidarum (strain NRRL Y-27907 / 11-Y1) TaxID=619300 RepID=G3AFR1_SPAPN|nr:uncharacterized protein SPAPADRAFT_48101 [Spathaspora passalidarum NRRL Y-27907]EGW35050.1 hypothetical protein SPAPADRAFT_48101 [Spathaspora passalidarum NRRL Y-27907]